LELPEAAPYSLLIAKVETAIKALKDLMLDNGWDSLAPYRQRAVAEAVEAMRLDVLEGERLEMSTCDLHPPRLCEHREAVWSVDQRTSPPPK